MISKIKIVFGLAFLSILKNKIATLSTISIFSLTLFLITLAFFSQILLSSFYLKILERADISLYFKSNVSEEEILKIKEKLSRIGGVKEVKYLSPSEILSSFLARHKNEPYYRKIIEELGSNPFLATLEIKLSNPKVSSNVFEFLNKEEIKKITESSNFYENQILLEKVSHFVFKIKIFLFLLLFFFLLLTFFTFSSQLKLSFFSQRKEFQIMNSLGASAFYLKGPFLFQAIFLGIFASFLNLSFWLLSLFLGKNFLFHFLGISPFSLFLANFPKIIILNLFSAIFLGSFFTLIFLKKEIK